MEKIIFVDTGEVKASMEVYLVGGANVLQNKHDTVCETLLHLVTKIPKEKSLKVAAKVIGGIAVLRKEAFL